jgi:O-antigen ligase
MTKKLDLPLILLAIAGFLAPLIGGHVAVDAIVMPRSANPWVEAVKGLSDGPTLSHAILAVLVTAAMVVMLLQRKILQVPNNTVSSLFLVLLALILSTVGYSSFRGTSIPAAIEWLTYGIAFYAVVAAAGREKGPMIILGAIFAGCVVLAYLGIEEYASNKATTPSWRIFGTWAGPNALAAILVVGMLLGIGLAINTERVAKLGSALGCIAIGLALFLTQSKGGLAALVVCLAFFAVLLAVWLPRKQILGALSTLGGVMGIVALLAIALSFQPKTAPATNGSSSGSAATLSPADRYVNAGASAEQSVGFRKLLWTSALKLIEQNPLGIGIDAFQYESARPGLTTQTHFAHDSYLQLGVESSIAAPLLLLAGIGFWARLLFRGGSKLQPSQNVLRASVLAATFAVIGHSLIDSDFSYYGIGLVVFMLMGIGLLLSSDAVAPEFLPAMLRRCAAVGIAAIALFLLYSGFTEAARAQAKDYVSPSTVIDARNRLESLRSMAPWDAEVWSLSALVTQDPSERLGYAKKAVELAPSTRNLRMLAKLSAGSGMYSDALGALQRALQTDPNNMQTLTLQADIQAAMGEEDKSQQTLEALVKVEETPYFKVRSLPEIIPTETYIARVRLASKMSDPQAKAAMLQPAIDGFKQYRTFTTPNIIRFAQTGESLTFGGDDLPGAEKKLSMAAEAARSLANAYRALRDPVKAAAADADAAELGKPLVDPSAK